MPDKLKKLFGWLDFGGSALTSVANVISTALTNKSNQRIAAAQNAMQIAENEKAYQRSKATNQVNLMRDAGMSKAGALNALNGGGSYQPAPMTSTPNQAPQIDMSSAFDGLIQIGENAKQRKMQEDMLDKQIQLERDKLQFEKDKWNEEKPVRDAHLTNLGLTNDILQLDKEVSQALKDGRINAENAENIARQAEAVLNDMRSKRVTDAMARMTDEELDNLFELQATLNMLQQGLQYDSTGAVIKAAKKLGSFVAKGSEAGKHIRTH